jgi:hypothetical protein
VAGRLPADARGPTAYPLSRRQILLNKKPEARTLFQTAAKDAPADGPLRKRVEEELAQRAKEK